MLSLHSSSIIEITLTMRRYYVDVFFMQHVDALPRQQSILDIGGHKINKRGQFDIDQYDQSIVYLNLTTDKSPDIQADAKIMPFAKDTFDVVICGELLEHVPDPRLVLRDIYRVLKPAGKLLLTVPFLYPIHADPYDYGRYTDYFWMENLQEIGYVDITIEKQGRLWSVVADFLYQYIRVRQDQKRFTRGMMRFLHWFQKRAVKLDNDSSNLESVRFNSFTTGFGIVCRKL